MEWDSDLEDPSSGEDEAEEEVVGTTFLLNGSGGLFSAAVESALGSAPPSYGLVVSDALEPDHPIIYVNEGFERATGYLAEEVLGRNWKTLPFVCLDAIKSPFSLFLFFASTTVHER